MNIFVPSAFVHLFSKNKVKAASEYQVRLEPVAVKGGITDPSQATSSIADGALAELYISKVTGTEGPSQPFNVSFT